MHQVRLPGTVPRLIKTIGTMLPGQEHNPTTTKTANVKIGSLGNIEGLRGLGGLRSLGGLRNLRGLGNLGGLRNLGWLGRLGKIRKKSKTAFV